MKVAIIGDSFTDEYIFGNVERLSPEVPVPILDVTRKEIRGGGAILVADNLDNLGIDLTLFTITNLKRKYKIVSPKGCNVLKQTRYIGNNLQLLRVDEPPHYLKKNLKELVYPTFDDFDIIVFVDYDKGIITKGKATIVDTRERDLSLFEGSDILRINQREFADTYNRDAFKEIFVTKGKDGIDFYKSGEFVKNEPTQKMDVADLSGAGATVTAVLAYCAIKGIKDSKETMELANKAAGITISKIGTSPISYAELFND